MWEAIDGWKRWIGLGVALLGVAACVEGHAHGWSFAALYECLKGAATSGETLIGVGVGVGGTGAVHARAKARAAKAAPPPAA